MEFFVDKDSVVRKIWGSSDTVLFIFAGASAEFALNKAVDWLYFTGRLPSDPLGRLFSTVRYARDIVFAGKEVALNNIDKITAIHKGVEDSRGYKMPDWAYRDVLFMLIHYSIASYELLENRLSNAEKEEVFQVFYRVGTRMGIPALPQNYAGWLSAQQLHLQEDLAISNYTTDLYLQYKKNLGFMRYKILLETQKLIVPERVRVLLGMRKFSWLPPVLVIYKLCKKIKLDGLLKAMLLPPAYKSEIKALDMTSA
jgi:hypothetical protein